MEFTSDFLIIGSGIAGLSVAYKIASLGSVHLVTKREARESNTNYAQGGIAAVLSQVDSFESHVNDTLLCGDGLCKRPVVEEIVSKGPARIQELIELGVKFSTRENSSELDLGKEGGHSKRRVAHVKDLTGQEVQKVLLENVRETLGIKIFENHVAVNLYVRKGQCLGAYVLDRENNEVNNFVARVTILASGGAGKVFLYTSNPDIATGDGIAMAYRAGASVANMEFTQFHPTCLYHPYAKSFLISEALRGEGALLFNRKGKRFMEGVHPLKELAPRDVVAREIDLELKKSGEECVFLDISHKGGEFIRSRFPGIYKKCLSYGIDITKDRIPVVPAAHYFCGGVLATTKGETDVPGLLAIGEVTCTGLHGANRLASNSLLEALVCAHNASELCASLLSKRPPPKSFPPWEPREAVDSDEQVVVTQNWDEIRRTMWNYVGIVRSNKRLERARARINLLMHEINQYYWDFKITSDLVELRNIALVARLIIESAIRRPESRGIHYTLDYPDQLTVARDTILTKNTISPY